MSPKRRTRGRDRNQSSLIKRLTKRRLPLDRKGRAGAREWGPIRIRRNGFGVYFRLAVAGLFVAALALGILTSRRVFETMLRGEQNALPVLVQSISVIGNQRLSLVDVARASGVTPGGLASEVNAEQVAKTLERQSWIRHANATLLPKGKLLVRIEERRPIALLRNSGPADLRNIADNPTVWRLVDPTGTPFARTRAEAWSRLPRFQSEKVLATGEVAPLLVKALSIVAFMRRKDAPQDAACEIELPGPHPGRGWVLHSQALPHTVILGERDLEPRLEKLALLLASDLSSARGAEEIDLRFANLAVLRSGAPTR